MKEGRLLELIPRLERPKAIVMAVRHSVKRVIPRQGLGVQLLRPVHTICQYRLI